jgi:hypothetical protein
MKKNYQGKNFVHKIGEWITILITYAGKKLVLSNGDVIKKVGRENFDFPMGSAFDIF